MRRIYAGDEKERRCAASRAWSKRNPDYVSIKNASVAAWKRANPVRSALHQRRAQLKRFGLTPDTHADLFKSQGCVCAACGSPDPGAKSGWHTDHNHDTNRLRGILCQPCNRALGYAKEDIHRLRSLALYVEKHQ